MSTEDSAAHQSAATTRRIDPDRLTRGVTETMTVDVRGPAQYEIARTDGDHEAHLVDVAAGTCDCEDAHFRNVACVHLVRASVHHAFRAAGNTRLVARVLRALDGAGCPHDVHGCAGPTTEGDRGLPCEGCIAATPGHWTVWCVVIDGRPAREVTPDAGATTDRPVATDGGEDQDDEGDPCAECGEDMDGRFLAPSGPGGDVCIMCDGEDDTDTEDDDDRGTKTVHGCATCTGFAHGSDDQCAECQQRGVEPIEDTPL